MAISVRPVRRRQLLASGVGALAALAAPNLVLAQARVVRMASVWGRGFPLVGDSAQRLAERLTAITDGALRVELFAAGELGSPGEAHAQAGAGEAEMYHGVEYFWAAKNPAFHLFSGVPFGLTGLELLGWLNGPGAEFWDAIQAPFNIKPFSAGMLAGGLGIWSNKPLESLNDFDGLSIRSSGLARTVLQSLGADARPVSFARLRAALSLNALDATEWFGPWADPSFEITEATRYIYGPPVFRPALGISVGLNLPFWFSLSNAQRLAFRSVFAAESQSLLLKTHQENARLLTEMQAVGADRKVREFNPELLTILGRQAGRVLQETMSETEEATEILNEFLSFRTSSYREVLNGASGFMKSRELPFSFAR
ncbi:MAG: hypothetical protein ACPG40_07140 [Alphaproteobacteria bacterium]